MPIPVTTCLPVPVYAAVMPGEDGTREVIDPRIATPVWRQLAAILRTRIRDGRYPNPASIHS
jgi:hypothetical protein